MIQRGGVPTVGGRVKEAEAECKDCYGPLAVGVLLQAAKPVVNKADYHLSGGQTEREKTEALAGKTILGFGTNEGAQSRPVVGPQNLLHCRAGQETK